ncbi:DUF6087 family protein [Streptomyces caelestis]|uniref:Uncharacterized protein n=1 Tax=Streptomyces caelestis TaxID=36816 RepID=A0A7W9H6R2_9ACTN|nr:DUF6087 family protein [Streptomyces caelestis]MBB5796697.1 hypothetical protein [Streptomyces caelestis]GGW33018.1 hypothetical protein GCM10010320_09880 [Streptomyces caelestis]
MDDEPLKDWAERRDARIGRLRAVPAVPGDGPRASHLNPDAPRAIERWNGHAWELYGFAASLAEAQAILYPEANEPSPPGPVPKPLGSGTGKHRKPQAPRPDGGGRAQR